MSFNRLAREEPSVGQEKRKRLHGNVRPARRKRKVEETIWKRKRGKRERERKKRRLGGCDRWDRCSFDRVLRLLRSQESPASPCSVDRRRSCWLRPLGFTGFYLGFAGLRFHKINKVIEIRWSLVFQVFPIHQNGREFSTSLGGFFLIFIHFCHSLTTFESAQRGWTVFCCVLSCFHLKGVPQRPEKKVAAAAEPLPIKSAPTAADSSVDLLERRRRQLALPRRPPPPISPTDGAPCAQSPFAIGHSLEEDDDGGRIIWIREQKIPQDVSVRWRRGTSSSSVQVDGYGLVRPLPVRAIWTFLDRRIHYGYANHHAVSSSSRRSECECKIDILTSFWSLHIIGLNKYKK